MAWAAVIKAIVSFSTSIYLLVRWMRAALQLRSDDDDQCKENLRRWSCSYSVRHGCVRILYVNVASRTRGILVFLSWKSRMYERPALLIKPAPKPPSRKANKLRVSSHEFSNNYYILHLTFNLFHYY